MRMRKQREALRMAEACLQQFMDRHYGAPADCPRAFSDSEAEEIVATLVRRRDAARGALARISRG